MCLSGRCSSCQHAAIDAGINHHDLHSVVLHNQSIGRGLRSRDDKPKVEIVDLTPDEVMDRMGRAMKYETSHTVELNKTDATRT